MFGNSPTSQTRRPIFARNGSSNDADSRKDVPFGVSLIWLPIYKAKPPKPQFWGREYAFSSQTREIKKHAYYRNYCIDSSQILHGDKDHQMPFMGDPNARTINSKMADSRHIGKIEKSLYLRNALARFFSCCKSLLRPRETVRSIATSVSICLSVCPLAYLRNHTSKLHDIFCTR